MKNSATSFSRYSKIISIFVLPLGFVGCNIFKKTQQTEKKAAVKQVNSAGVDGSILFDMNDLSILFSRDKPDRTGKIYPEIKVTDPVRGQSKWPKATDSAGASGQIWDQTIFNSVVTNAAASEDTKIHFQNGGFDNNFSVAFRGTEKDIKTWQIVSFRFIPCVLTSDVISKGSPTIPSPGCVTQLRLIAQPVNSNGGNSEPFDVAAHLVYSFELFPSKIQAGIVKASLEKKLQTPNLPETAKQAINGQIAFLSQIEAIGFTNRDEMAKAIANHPQIGKMIADLQAIKGQTLSSASVNTNGMPLGAHPGLLKEVQDGRTVANPGPIAQAVSQFLGDHLTTFHLSNISFMGLNQGGPEPWVFFGGDMGDTPDGPSTPTFTQGENWVAANKLLYRLKGAFPAEVGRKDKAIALSFLTPAGFFPVPSAPFNLSSLFANNADTNLGHAVDNPSIVNNFTADCVSCHVGTTRMATLRDNNNALIALPNKPERFKTVEGISGYIEPTFMSRGRWNLRNFGFFSDPRDPAARPKITLRILNEAIDSVELTNQAVASVNGTAASAVKHPGMTCSDDEATWLCTVSNGPNCFSSCKVAAAPVVTPVATPIVGDGGGGPEPVLTVLPPQSGNCTTTKQTTLTGDNKNVVFDILDKKSLKILNAPNEPAGKISVSLDIVVDASDVSCDENDLCRAFPQPTTTTDQQNALVSIFTKNGNGKGANVAVAKNAAFVGVLQFVPSNRNLRSGTVAGFINKSDCN